MKSILTQFIYPDFQNIPPATIATSATFKKPCSKSSKCSIAPNLKKQILSDELNDFAGYSDEVREIGYQVLQNKKPYFCKSWELAWQVKIYLDDVLELMAMDEIYQSGAALNGNKVVLWPKGNKPLNKTFNKG
jgi:hypothetical protein